MVLSITQIQLNLVLTTKTLLQTLKDVGFDILLAHVQSVCTQYEIDVHHIKGYKSFMSATRIGENLLTLSL
jgi:hypothetical protein